jgi:nucleoid DNA-binding protein
MASVQNKKQKTKNMTLTKRDLVVRISAETGLIQSQVFDVVQATLDHIAETLAKGDKVELRNFGIFDVKIRWSNSRLAR